MWVRRFYAVAGFVLFALVLHAQPGNIPVREYHLTIAEEEVNYAGKDVMG
jgi:hypothetical protein